MSDSPHDELRDRLVDRALREVLSGETPPDLTDSILGVFNSTEAPKVSAPTKQVRPHRNWIIALVTVASVVVMAGMWVIPKLGGLMQVTQLKIDANGASNVSNEGDSGAAGKSAAAAMSTEETYLEQQNFETEERGLERSLVVSGNVAEDEDRELRAKDLAKNGRRSGLDVSRGDLGRVETDFSVAGGRSALPGGEALGEHSGESERTAPATPPTEYGGAVDFGYGGGGYGGGAGEGYGAAGGAYGDGDGGGYGGGYGAKPAAGPAVGQPSVRAVAVPEDATKYDRSYIFRQPISGPAGVASNSTPTNVKESLPALQNHSGRPIQLGTPAPSPATDMNYYDAKVPSQRNRGRGVAFSRDGRAASTQFGLDGAQVEWAAQRGQQRQLQTDGLAESTTALAIEEKRLALRYSADHPIRKAFAEQILVRTKSQEAIVRRAAIKSEIDQASKQIERLARQISAPTGNQKPEDEINTLITKLGSLRDEHQRLAQERPGNGRGPGDGGDQYTRIYENPFVVAEGTDAVSTFSIDVDTASYTNARQYLLDQRRLPPPDAVRIEEFVNYFDYDYLPPSDDKPFASSIEIAGCPWQPKHQLLRVGIKGKVVDREQRPSSNLVFLVDVSGSMTDSNKLPLVIEGLKQLTHGLSENDRVAIVVYASREGLALPSTRGDMKQAILSSLSTLRAGGSTAGGAGIQLAYKIAEENFISKGTNRVILCTDGDFNVGVTSTSDLERMAEQKAKSGVFLTVLGFGRGNLNDSMMESISNKGNGNYHYIDNAMEARKVLVRQMSGTLVTIAKDVKIQIEFNPAKVAGYRLLGYENRLLAREDFSDDTKDAGEIGAGHAVTALYELIPVGEKVDVAGVEPLRYQQPAQPVQEEQASSLDEQGSSLQDEILMLRIRYKEPDGEKSKLLEFPIRDAGAGFSSASEDFQFAASVAGFGLLLRDSQFKGNANVDSILEIATGGASKDEFGYREGFLAMMKRAKELGLP